MTLSVWVGLLVLAPASLARCQEGKVHFQENRSGWLGIDCQEFTDIQSLVQKSDPERNNAKEEQCPNPKEITVWLQNQTKINLRQKNITKFHSDTFRGLSGLKHLYLDQNLVTSLPGGLFCDLTSLLDLDLGHNRLTSLPADLLHHLPHLSLLLLRHNPGLFLSSPLPPGFLRNNTNLREFTARNTDIRELPQDLFRNTQKLEVINLGQNSMATLPDTLFQGLTTLYELHLDQNNLTTDALAKLFLNDLTSLETIKLHNNALTSPVIPILTPLKRSLWKINLKNNLLTTFENGWAKYFSELEKLDLSKNKINGSLSEEELNFTQKIEINLEDNFIRRIKLDSLFERNCSKKIPTVSLSGNKLHCGCFSSEIASLHENSQQCVKVKDIDTLENEAKARCSQRKSRGCPLPYQSITTEKYAGKETDEEFRCPDLEFCFCYYSRVNQLLEVDCAGAGADFSGRDLPSVRGPTLEIHLNLSSSGLTSLQTLFTGVLQHKLRKIRRLDLGSNQIAHLLPTDLPPALQHLNLHNNPIEHYSEDSLEYFEKFSGTLTLGHDSFLCDCSSTSLITFLERHSSKVNDTDNITFNCATPKHFRPGQGEANITKEDVCPDNLIMILICSIVLAFLLLLILVLMVLYRELLLLWLYSLPCLARWSPEDWSLPYDVFLSYSHHDQDWVEGILHPLLEEDLQPSYR